MENTERNIPTYELDHLKFKELLLNKATGPATTASITAGQLQPESPNESKMNKIELNFEGFRKDVNDLLIHFQQMLNQHFLTSSQPQLKSQKQSKTSEKQLKMKDDNKKDPDVNEKKQLNMNSAINQSSTSITPTTGLAQAAVSPVTATAAPVAVADIAISKIARQPQYKTIIIKRNRKKQINMNSATNQSSTSITPTTGLTQTAVSDPDATAVAAAASVVASAAATVVAATSIIGSQHKSKPAQKNKNKKKQGKKMEDANKKKINRIPVNLSKQISDINQLVPITAPQLRSGSTQKCQTTEIVSKTRVAREENIDIDAFSRLFEVSTFGEEYINKNIDLRTKLLTSYSQFYANILTAILAENNNMTSKSIVNDLSKLGYWSSINQQFKPIYNRDVLLAILWLFCSDSNRKPHRLILDSVSDEDKCYLFPTLYGQSKDLVMNTRPSRLSFNDKNGFKNERKITGQSGKTKSLTNEGQKGISITQERLQFKQFNEVDHIVFIIIAIILFFVLKWWAESGSSSF